VGIQLPGVSKVFLALGAGEDFAVQLHMRSKQTLLRGDPTAQQTDIGIILKAFVK
jgi:hypothetical protein